MLRLYKNIQTLRLERKIKSVRQLEILCGINIGTIKKWKNNLPRCEPVIKLANFFGVTTDFLFGLENRTLVQLNPNIMKIVDEATLRNIDEHTANIIVKVIRAIDEEKLHE